MKVVVIGSQEQFDTLKKGITDVEWVNGDNAITDADAFFYLDDAASIPGIAAKGKPVFINNVMSTLKSLNATENIFRINGWPTFLERNDWEVAGNVNENIHALFSRIGKKIITVPDEPGLVAARVISMIVNEAYFALEEEVSTKEEIDIAMKLGTNYPYGPFEWATKIGLKKIQQLLQKLSETDNRYQPAALLEKEATEQ